MNSKQRRKILRKWEEQVKATRVYTRLNESLATYFFGETDLSVSRYLQAWADGKLQRHLALQRWEHSEFFDTLTKRGKSK